MNLSSSKKLAQPLKVGILGGSVDGITLALLLRDLGCNVHIYERKKALPIDPIRGIWVDTFVSKYLTEYTNISSEAFSVKTKYLRYLNDKGYSISEEEQTKYFTSHEILFDNLFTLFGSKNYHFEHEINGFIHEADKVIVSFTNDEKDIFDLLICTEGIDSLIRSTLLPNATLNYAGYVGWRGSIQESDLNEDTFNKFKEALSYQLLPNSHIVSYPVRSIDNKISINYTWYQNVVKGPLLNELLTGIDGKLYEYKIPNTHISEKHKIELLEVANKNLNPDMAALINATKNHGLEVIYDMQVPHMVFEKIVLMGNSAFYSRPHAGMSISKAMIDAWELAGNLSFYNGDLTVALQEWERKQLYLGKQIVNKSALMGNRSQFENSWQPGDKNLNLGLP
ncbi:hypothetical protein GTQ40_10305 [Flavobacteriaceae bacterium R38]|nr:hypothetical protein [Flavobacteriaceae bacterium R38]